MKESDFNNMVECHYRGSVTFIPVKLFFSMTSRIGFEDRKFVRYKDGARIYSMSENSFIALANDAGAVYHPGLKGQPGKIAMVNVALFDEFLECFRG